MDVPAYYRTRRGRMFRIQRATEQADGGSRFVLRAFAVQADANGATRPAAEVGQDVSLQDLRERIRRRVVGTPEHTFEQLWQQLRADLEAL